MVINPIVGVYIPIIRIPIKGGMTIPNIATFDHGTYTFLSHLSIKQPLRFDGDSGFIPLRAQGESK